MGTLLTRTLTGTATTSGAVLGQSDLPKSLEKIDSPSRVFKATVYNRGENPVTVVLQGTTGDASLSVSGSAGTFRLTWNGNTTAAIAYNANATAIQTALRALPGGSLISVSGGSSPFTISNLGSYPLSAYGTGGTTAKVTKADSWTQRGTTGTVAAKSSAVLSGAIRGREAKLRFLATSSAGESEVIVEVSDESDSLRR